MNEPNQLRVHEIYSSIQGESTFAGLPCVFVRTSRCNLRCRWCDTAQAFEGGEWMDLSTVAERALAHAISLIEITGGEPLLQPATLPLITMLADAGKTVLLETSGERDISKVDPRAHRIMDLKAPGSGESERIRWSNLAHLTKRDEVKIVLADRRDYEWAREILTREKLHERVGEVLLSCVHGELEAKNLVQWVLEDHLPVRVQLQLHKVIWAPDTQGV